jgi:hypothetical protein
MRGLPIRGAALMAAQHPVMLGAAVRVGVKGRVSSAASDGGADEAR